MSRAAALVLCLVSTSTLAGPVEVYREGSRFCPRDRAPSDAVLTEAQAIARARALLPAAFCGPTVFVSGCDAEAEYAIGSWRIYFHQYRLQGARHDWGGLEHTYVILDPVGNCYANIPGTVEGATR